MHTRLLQISAELLALQVRIQMDLEFVNVRIYLVIVLACDMACGNCLGAGSTNCDTCSTSPQYYEIIDADLIKKDCRSSCPAIGYYTDGFVCRGDSKFYIN